MIGNLNNLKLLAVGKFWHLQKSLGILCTDLKQREMLTSVPVNTKKIGTYTIKHCCNSKSFIKSI